MTTLSVWDLPPWVSDVTMTFGTLCLSSFHASPPLLACHSWGYFSNQQLLLLPLRSAIRPCSFVPCRRSNTTLPFRSINDRQHANYESGWWEVNERRSEMWAKDKHLATSLAPPLIKQYLLYCTKQWIYEEEKWVSYKITTKVLHPKVCRGASKW